MKQLLSTLKHHLKQFYANKKLLEFVRRANTPLSNVSTTTKNSDLSYDEILDHYLDEETLTPN